MIELNPDYLIFEDSEWRIPCSAELATLDFLGPEASAMDAELVKNAAAAVLHYFKHELNQQSVSVGEFAQALQKVFDKLGVDLNKAGVHSAPRVQEADLARLARLAGDGSELFFFSSLRGELKQTLKEEPRLVRFNGLRACAMLLTGTQRWTRRSQAMSEQIVAYLRTYWSAELADHACTLMVS